MVSYIISSTIWMVVLAIFVFIVFYFVLNPLRKISFYSRKDALITFFPLIGVLKTFFSDLKLKNDFFASVKEFSRRHPTKKFLVSNIGNRPVVLLRDAQYAREFLQKQNFYQKADYAKGFNVFGGTGLVLSEGENWKLHRKIISNSFHYEFLKVNTQLIQDTAREFLDKISPSDYQGYAVISRLQEITGEIVGRIFFGENLNNYTYEGVPLTIALAEIISELAMHGRSIVFLLFGPKVRKLPIFPKYMKTMQKVKKFSQICGKIIQDRKAQGKQGTDPSFISH